MEWTEMDWTQVTELGTAGFLVSAMFLHILLLNFLFSFSNCVSKQRKHFVAKATHS